MKTLSLTALMIILCLFCLSSCMTESNYRRGSLSDAMDKSKDDYPEEREVPSERKEKPWRADDDDSEYDSEYEDESESEETSASASGGGGTGPAYLAGRGGNAHYSEPYFDSLYDGELLLGFGVDHTEILLYGGIKAVTAQADSALKESIEDGVLFLRGGIEGRYYPFPELQVFCPYVLAQAGGMYMYWSFKNPIAAGSETITNDSVAGLTLGTGAGMDLIHTKLFRLGGAFIPELYLFYSETQEGFENDVFDAYVVVRWAFELGFFIN
jgi:hypothetical protein